jgi:1,2-diacylglycerol 3-alpha-glucosyltransferase
MLSSRVEAMIAPSRKIEDVLEKYNVLCPVEVIPSGIDTDKFSTAIFADRVEKLYMNVCELQALVLRAC